MHAKCGQADVADLEVAGVLHFRRAAQLAIEPVSPAVVLAVQGARALAVAQREWSGAVAAHIRECAQHAVLAANEDDRRAGDVLDDMIARIGELPLVRDELPAAREYRAVFHREHGVAEVVLRVEGVGVAEVFHGHFTRRLRMFRLSSIVQRNHGCQFELK